MSLQIRHKLTNLIKALILFFNINTEIFLGEFKTFFDIISNYLLKFSFSLFFNSIKLSTSSQTSSINFGCLTPLK